MNPVEYLTTVIKPFFETQFEAVWKNFTGFFPDLLEQVWNKFTEKASSIEEGAWAAMVDSYINSGILPERSRETIMQLKDKATPIDIALYVSLNVMLMMSYLNAQAVPGQAFHLQELNQEHRPNLPDEGSILQASFVAPEKTAQVRDIFKKKGYKDEDIDLYFLSRYRLYGEGEIRELYLRGILNEDEVYMRMRELGYTDTRIKELIPAWSTLPGLGDIIHMAYAGSFDPANKQKWPWAFQAPGAFVEAAGKLGLSPEWCEKLWYMHWTQPGVREMFEMMHREAISEEDLDHTLKVVGYSDYWIEKLKTITYAPYTRVDVRRMHDMGILDDEALVKSYMDLGYDVEKAVNMARFTIQYNAENDRTLTMTQVLNAYMEKLMTKDQAVNELTLMGYSEPRAEFLLAYEEYKEDREYREAAIDNVRDRYQNNLITKQDAYDRLSALDLDGRRIQVLIDKWSLNIFEDRKLPSKTDLDKFLRNNIIDYNTYYHEMEKLGYNYLYIKWYHNLIKKKKAG